MLHPPFRRRLTILLSCILLFGTMFSLAAGQALAKGMHQHVAAQTPTSFNVSNIDSNCSASSFTPIVSFHAGDTISGTATLVTTVGDPASEATEHEDLMLQGTNVPSIPSIAVDTGSQSFSFIATGDGSLTACVGGGDGDESGTVTGTVTPASTPTPTPTTPTATPTTPTTTPTPPSKFKFVLPSDLLKHMSDVLKAHGLAFDATKCIASHTDDSEACGDLSLKLAGLFPGPVGGAAKDLFRQVAIAKCVAGILVLDPAPCSSLALLAIEELLNPTPAF